MASERIDFAAEGLLHGLRGRQRKERLQLLEHLAAEGVELSELRRTTASGTLMFLPAERLISGEERYTAAEVADRGGIDIEFLLALRRAMGLPIPDPDERVYTATDLEMARMTTQGRALGISDEEMLELDRTLGRALAQAAEALRAVPLRLVLEPGLSEQQLALRHAHAVSQLYPMVAPLVTGLLALHIRNVAQSEIISAAERSGGRLAGSREVAVCFADLVGFTRLGEEVPPGELSNLAGRLEALASDAAQRPVRLVKTIGDAAMLTCTEPEPLIDATLGLLDAAEGEAEDFLRLRAGMAIGPALSRAGDWFGRPVNLASRITAIARPGSVLAEREVHDSVPDAYRWSYAGERRLRGVRDPVALFRARRLSD